MTTQPANTLSTDFIVKIGLGTLGLCSVLALGSIFIANQKASETIET